MSLAEVSSPANSVADRGEIRVNKGGEIIWYQRLPFKRFVVGANSVLPRVRTVLRLQIASLSSFETWALVLADGIRESINDGFSSGRRSNSITQHRKLDVSRPTILTHNRGCQSGIKSLLLILVVTTGAEARTSLPESGDCATKTI